MSSPRNLHVIWDEYVNGVAGNKPAKFFTRAEEAHANSSTRAGSMYGTWLIGLYDREYLRETQLTASIPTMAHSCPLQLLLTESRLIKRQNECLSCWVEMRRENSLYRH